MKITQINRDGTEQNVEISPDEIADISEYDWANLITTISVKGRFDRIRTRSLPYEIREKINAELRLSFKEAPKGSSMEDRICSCLLKDRLYRQPTYGEEKARDRYKLDGIKAMAQSMQADALPGMKEKLALIVRFVDEIK